MDSIDFDLTPYARYNFGANIIDRLPYLTFLIGTGDGESNLPSTAVRIVNARADGNYPPRYVTPGGRLLYQFWTGMTSDTDSVARRQLNMVDRAKRWAWVIQPEQDGYDMLDAFKIACDHRVNKHVPKTLLYRALGLDEALT